MGQEQKPPDARCNALYEEAMGVCGAALDRLAAGYEADPSKRLDLRQEIHFQLWRSFEIYDGRCSLKTWSFRVAHNTAVSYAAQERRRSAGWVGLEQVEQTAPSREGTPDIDGSRTLQQLSRLILQLKPLDRQILLCYLEEMDAAAIAEITGLKAPNVAMKIHRIKRILARQFQQEQSNV